MRINTSKQWRSDPVTLALTVRYMLLGPRVRVLFGKAEIYDIYFTGRRRIVWRKCVGSHKKIRGLDVAVNELSGVDVFNQRKLR